MEDAGGNNNGGFHGYRTLPQTTLADTKATGDSKCTIREQDRFMPIANVVRIMRKILPPHAKISDDAKETIQESVSEYISFITDEANERCKREQRKTISAEDVLWAMSELGFDDYIEPLTVYLHRFRQFDGGDRASIRGEPLVLRRMIAEHASAGFQAYPPPATASAAAFHHMAHRPINFFKNPENGESSQSAAEGFPQCKEE